MPEINCQTKELLIKEIHTAYNSVYSFIENLDEESFVYSPADKWSASGQLEHLILSSKGIASALKMSRLKFMPFGKSKDGSRSYEELFGKYKDVLSTGMKAPPKFSPDPNKNWAKAELLDNWKMIGDKLQERTGTWSEKDLDTLRLPHPAIGKITVREMLNFTVFHAYHHLTSMKNMLKE